MASGLPASPFAAAPQASLSNLGWGIEWSSAEGRWVAAAQPGAKPQPGMGEGALSAERQPRDEQSGGLAGAVSAAGDSLAQLERVGSAGEPSAASEAGHAYQHAGANAAPAGELPAQPAQPAEGELSRQHSAASEAGLASDEAALPHAQGAATRQPLGSAAPGTLSRKNSSCLEGGAGPDSGSAQRSASGGPSKYRGVIWHKSNSKWEARIYDSGKQRFLGYYTSEEEAARVYDDAAAKMTGRPVNFPNDHKSSPLEESLSRANSASDEPLDQEGAALRVSTRGQARKKSSADSPPPAVKGSSKYRGVSWNSNCNKWRAQVWKGNDVRHLGYFDDEMEAAKAYDKAAVELRGLAAPTNFDTDLLSEVAAAGQLAAGLPEATQEEMDRVDSYFLGVSWDDGKSCWKAEIWDGNAYTLLGHFDTEDGAARAHDRACLKLHAAEANTNYPPEDYEGELEAAALLSAVPLSAAAAPGASDAGNSDDEDARRSELELSAMHALASISSDEAESFDSKEEASAAERRHVRSVPEGVARHLSNPTPEGPASAPPALRPAMSDPIERSALGLRRRKSTRISDADAATAAVALAGLTGKPAPRSSRSMSPDHSMSMSAGTSVGRRNSGRSGPVASDQAKSSAYKGVSWHKHSQKWYAYIQSGGKMRGLGYFDSQADAAKAYDAEARKVHGKKAVVNFRLSSGEIQWQPRNKRGMSNSSAETSCPSFGASPEASEQSGSAGPRMRTGQRNPSRASSGRSERARSATPARDLLAASDTVSAEEKPAQGKPQARSRLAAESGFARMSTQRPASATGEKPPVPNLAPLNMANIPPFQADRDGEGSPTESCMSMDSIPMRKRSRKPKHVYNAADVAPPQAPWKSSIYKPVKKDPQEAAKALPADLDKPMVLRSKDGARGKRSRTELSPPAPATTSGTEPERREPRTLYKGVSRLEKERKWVARVWVDSKQRTLGRYDSDMAAAQAYDRAVLRMKGADAATNFPASMYGDLDIPDASAPLQTADASCTISLPDTGISGESDHPSPSRPCNAPLPLFKGRASAQLSPLGAKPPAELEGFAMEVPGTKTTSQYRGVSRNKAIGQWMAVVWNFQERKTQIVGNYASEIEAAKAYDRAVKLNGGAIHQLNFPFSPELEALPDATNADAAAGVPTTVLSALQDLSQHAAASQPTQGPGAGQSDQAGPSGQLTSVNAYDQLASILRANPDASPLIAQALQNMQNSASARQGSFTEVAQDAAQGRRGHTEPVQHPMAGDERPPSTRPMPYQRPSRDGLTRNRVQAAMKNSSRFRGVSLNKASRKWEARIRESGKNHYLGSFTDEEMAARAFDSAAIAMRGPQAVCNFPREGSSVKMHTFGHAPSRQIMVRASPDEPYHAVSPRAQLAAPPPAGLPKGVQQLPAVEPSPTKLVHYDKGSGMWLTDPAGVEAATEGSQEPRGPTLGSGLPSSISPGGEERRAPSLADLGNEDIPKERRSPLQMQRVSSGQGEPDEARLPGPGPGRRSSKYKGVSWAEASLKWRTQIWTGTKVQYIGYYDHELEAAKAYDRAILKFRGPGHQVNFTEEDYTPEEIASAPKVEPQGDEPFMLQGTSPRAGFAERYLEGSPRARSSGRGSLSPRQASLPKTVPTGRAAPDSQVYHQGTSQFKGVSWAERSKKWRAQLWFGNKVNHLGFFEYEEEAARAYDAAARAIRGPQASTNFPDAGGGAPLSARTITTSGRPGDSSTVVETIPRINVNPKGSSMYKGVRWHERNGKWEARIFDSAAQKQVSLGYYEKEVDAARAYDAESLRLRGPSGHINLPESRALIEAHLLQNEGASNATSAGSAEMGDDRWAIKRPRGTNPAIERGDLEAIAAVAAAVASAGRPGTAAGRKSRQSRFRGVVWDEDSQKWAVCLSPGDGAVEKQLGLFTTEEAAAGAYDALAVELWGPSTPTNFHSQGVAALPEGSHIPKKPRTDSAAASRHSAAMYVLDSGDAQPSAPAPLASAARAASPCMRQRVLDDAQRREDESSAAAASNLVDFFQSAAQRWRAPILAEPAAGGDSATQEASAMASDSVAAGGPEAVQSEVPSALHPTSAQEPAAEGAQSADVADPSYRVPVLAAIQSWQPSAGSTGAEASGNAPPGQQAAPEPLKMANAAPAQPPLASFGVDAIQQALKPAAASSSLATAAAVPADGNPVSAAAAPLVQKQGEKGAPNLITPPKEALMPNAASRPFSADTA